MKTPIIAYKMVRKSYFIGEPILVSCEIHVARSVYRVFYSTKYWSVGLVGKLFVFPTLQKAISYLNEFDEKSNFEIWECEVKNPVKAEFVFPVWRIGFNSISDFWRKVPTLTKADLQYNNVVNCPDDSLYCDSLRLIKKCEIEKDFQQLIDSEPNNPHDIDYEIDT